MNRNCAISMIGPLALSFVLLIPAACLADSVTVAVGSTQAGAGKEVEIPITIKGTAGIGALQLDLTFDPKILEAKTVDKGPLAPNALLEFNSQQPGRLRVGMVIMNGLPAEGIVATAHLSVRGKDGDKTPVTLERVEAWNFKTDLDYLVSTQPGVFTVTAGWPWLLIAAGAALVLLIVMLATRRRKQPQPA
jgi:hypothetical protein